MVGMEEVKRPIMMGETPSICVGSTIRFGFDYRLSFQTGPMFRDPIASRINFSLANRGSVARDQPVSALFSPMSERV